MSSSRPKLICLTPIRNDAWVLDLFLNSASTWADYIILADQQSVDGTADIIKKYPKVRVIPYNEVDFNEGRQRALLVEEARKIEGPRILFALDSDEVLSANFQQTDDWQSIVNSSPGDVFAFQWATITPDRQTYYPVELFCPWVVHDDGSLYKKYVKQMHGMRIPYPDSADYGWHKVYDFKVLHLDWINPFKNQSKSRYYQCVVKINYPRENLVNIYRGYHFVDLKELPLPDEWIVGKEYKVDFNRVDTTLREFWYDHEIARFFDTYGVKKFRSIDIWDKEFIGRLSKKNRIIDPRHIGIKVVFAYFKSTQKYYTSWPIRAIDKLIKIVSRLNPD